MKRRILNIILLVTIVALVGYSSGAFNSIFKPSTAYAVGDLTVNWGVPEGQPIFVVSNFAPGQSQTRIVSVTNNASGPKPTGVRGDLTSQTVNLSTVLDFVIRDGGTDVYGGTSSTGPKTLAQFFSESATISGIALSNIPAGGTKNYSFIVTFQQSAGDVFQNASLVFDVHVGIFFDIPAACTGIAFLGSPKFGTSGNDRINGTNGNDLILGMEGNDSINGGNGNDCIVVLNGNGTLRGGNGTDIIEAGTGNNTIDGGNGNDKITAGNGNNRVLGGNGDDKITTGSGVDNISGGNGNDEVSSGGGNDVIGGGNGNDVVDGGSGNDSMKGGNGSDKLTGGDGTDSAQGQNGTDTCSAEVSNTCEL